MDHQAHAVDIARTSASPVGLTDRTPGRSGRLTLAWGPRTADLVSQARRPGPRRPRRPQIDPYPNRSPPGFRVYPPGFRV
jgi:hypothetical protein